MAVTQTDRGDTQTTAGQSTGVTVVSASFTPTVGNLVTVGVSGIFSDGGASATNYTITNTGFTVNAWTSRGTITRNDGGTYSLRVSIFSGQVTASAAGTVTCTRAPSGQTDQWMVMQVHEWAGHGGTGMFASTQDALASGSTITVTFASTPATTSAAVGLLYDNNGSTTGAVQPTGWTEVADLGAASVGGSVDAAFRIGSVQQAPQWTALQSGTAGKVAACLEILEAASGSASANAVAATVTVAGNNPTTTLTANPPAVNAAVTVAAANPTETVLSNASAVAATVAVDATNPTTNVTGGATVPGAPTSLAATPGDTQVALTWTTPASDGGSAITDYTIQYRVSP